MSNAGGRILLAAALLAACTSADETTASGAHATSRQAPAAMREAFEQARNALLAFAAPLGAHERTALVVDLDEDDPRFAAKADVVKPSAEEAAQGVRFRRRIVVRAGVLSEPVLSADGLALLLCHELGHHYGGYPFQRSDGLTSAEGSADYYATRACGPAVLRAYRADEPAPTDALPGSCRSTRDPAFCGRLAAASLSLVRALHAHIEEAPETVPPYASTNAEPSLVEHDEFEVERTVAGRYPSLQCRLDTMVRGALCGLGASTVPEGLVTPAETERDALGRSCSVASFEPGARPRCWFHEGSMPTGLSEPIEEVWRGRSP